LIVKCDHLKRLRNRGAKKVVKVFVKVIRKLNWTGIEYRQTIIKQLKSLERN